MGCDYPMKAWRPLSYERALTFNSAKALNSDNPIGIPCGQCMGCRMDKSREWAIRCVHEAQMHQQNCFITLTFANEHLPENFSISKRDLQLFFKRLRKSIEPIKIRYYSCGEYGKNGTERPHYHALIFGYDFNQKTVYSIKRGKYLYTSPELNKLWPYGISTIGSIEYQSAAYCARYSMKKVGGDRVLDHYCRRHPLTGKVYLVEPEFCLMSSVPGIGQTWLDKYYSDVFPHDYVVLNGRKHPVPRFYTRKLPDEELEEIKRTRKRAAVLRIEDRVNFKPTVTRERLEARRVIRESRASLLKRELD